LTQNLSYNLHSRRELAEDYHHLHGGREIEASIFEISKVAQHVCDCWSRVGVGRDGHQEELAKLSIGRINTGGTETLFEVVSDLFYSSKVSNSNLDGGSEVQGDVTKCSLGVVVPVLSVIMAIGGLSHQVNEPLALCPEVGLHGGMPLLPVGASEEGNHLVESTGHGEFLLGVNRVSR